MKNKIIILIGKSGTGKTTILQEFIKQNKNYKQIENFTTREKRQDEQINSDYTHLTKEEFLTRTIHNGFSSRTVYNGNHYGLGKIIEGNDYITIMEPTGIDEFISKFKTNFKIYKIKIETDNNIRLKRINGDVKRETRDEQIFDNYKKQNYTFKNNEEVDLFKITNNIKIITENRFTKNKICYIAHKINGNEKNNKEKIKTIAKNLSGKLFIPFSPYLLFLDFLDDNNIIERKLGFNYNKQFFKRRTFDFLLVYGEISKGMKEEISWANTYGIPILFF